MCVDNGRVKKHELTISPRIPSRWIPDERVVACFNCAAMFTFFRRKHHCRSCGRIFCRPCSSYREVLPFSTRYTTPQRVCLSCFDRLRKTQQVAWLISALSVMPLTFIELFVVRLLDKEWNYAVNQLLGMYRG